MVKINNFKLFYSKLRHIHLLVIFFLIITVIFAAIIINTETLINDTLRDELKGIAGTVASGIDGDAIVTLSPGDEKTPLFHDIQGILRKARTSTLNITYIYLLEKQGNKVSFLVDADYGFDPSGASIGLEYLNPNDEMIAGFSGPSADTELVTDSWGTMLSGYAPIYNSTGAVVAIVGVDMDVSDVAKRAGLSKLLLILIFFAFILIISTGVFLYERKRELLERERENAYKELSFLVDAIPSAVVFRSHDKKVLRTNPIYQSIAKNTIIDANGKESSKTVSDALIQIEDTIPKDKETVQNTIITLNQNKKQYYTVLTAPLLDQDGARRVFLSVLTDISDLHQALEDFESQQRVFWQVGELSSLLLQSGDSETLLKRALIWMCEMMNVDRIVICEHQEQSGHAIVITRRHIWERRGDNGVYITDEPLTEYPESYINWYPDLAKGKTVTGELSYSHENFFKDTNIGKVRSYLIVPIKLGYDFCGILSFETIDHEHTWNSKEKSALKAFAITIGQFIQRSRTATALLWNEALLTAMVTSSPLGFLVVDNRTDDILFANEQFCKIWKLESFCKDITTGKLKNNDIIPYCIPILIDPEAFGESCTPLQDENNRICVDDEITFIDGRTIRRYSTQIRGQSDEYYGRFYIFEDITAKKQIEEALKENEEKLTAIFENQQAMIIVDGSTRKIVSVNHEAATLIGLPKEDIEGKLCHSFICPAEKEKCPIMDLGQIVDRSERVLLSKTRGRIPVIKAVHPIIQEEKTYLIESFIDITERKRNEENLQKINSCLLSFGPDPIENINKLTKLAGELLNADQALYSRFEKGIISTPAVWHIDPEFTILEEPQGHLCYEVIAGKSDAIFFITDLSKTSYCATDPLVSRYNLHSCIGKAVRIGGEYLGSLCIFYTISKNQNPADNQLMSVIAAAIGMEEERKRALDQLNDFAYIISHDLKAPLRGISSLAQWLKEDFQKLLPTEGVESLDLMNARVLRMQNLINGVLEYSRIGRMHQEKEDIDLHSLLNEIIDSLSVPESYIIIIPKYLPTIAVDRIQITQIFENLISNAIKYAGKEDVIIEILSDRADGYYIFGVKDNGPGIDPRYHDKIFQIFQTLHQKKGYESTGVGLTIVRKIVEHLGGRVWVESESGAGAVFYFTIPAPSTDIPKN